jgi:predicted SprT family Zn-dependent metalloprotease
MKRERTFLQLVLPLLAPLERWLEPEPLPLPARGLTADRTATSAVATTTPTAKASSEASLLTMWQASAPEWGRVWGVPDLATQVRLETSHRMRTSLGGFYARERVIRIADTLFEAPPNLLHEVLCHEAAHAAVEILHGPRARSHGREWKELMRRVGLEPRVHVPGAELGGASQRAARKRWVWRHRCPHCRAERLAGRPVRQWRCRACVDAGGDGKLTVTRIAARALRSRD